MFTQTHNRRPWLQKPIDILSLDNQHAILTKIMKKIKGKLDLILNLNQTFSSFQKNLNCGKRATGQHQGGILEGNLGPRVQGNH